MNMYVSMSITIRSCAVIRVYVRLSVPVCTCVCVALLFVRMLVYGSMDLCLYVCYHKGGHSL